MIDKDDAELRAALMSKGADERFMAAYVIGERRLRWPTDLIPLLDDPTDLIRQAARRSLIILSFLDLNPEEATRIAAGGREPTPLAGLNKPVDFGPAAGAGKSARKTAVGKWTEWWAGRDPTGEAFGAGGLGADPERLANALIKVDAERRAGLVAEYRDAKGVQYTEAMAAAISRSPAAARSDLRDALAARLGRMTNLTLGRYLHDPLPEIRRAAALALAEKGSTDHVGRLSDLLSDPDPLVVEAAHAALSKLSGTDLGPGDGASDADRAEAGAAWRKWWQAKKAAGR
jgi:HEAT repeat protein